jgi:hypothetical protein
MVLYALCVVFVYSRFIENLLIWSWETNPSFLRRFYHTHRRRHSRLRPLSPPHEAAVHHCLARRLHPPSPPGHCRRKSLPCVAAQPTVSTRAQLSHEHTTVDWGYCASPPGMLPPPAISPPPRHEVTARPDASLRSWRSGQVPRRTLTPAMPPPEICRRWTLSPLQDKIEWNFIKSSQM